MSVERDRDSVKHQEFGNGPVDQIKMSNEQYEQALNGAYQEGIRQAGLSDYIAKKPDFDPNPFNGLPQHVLENLYNQWLSHQQEAGVFADRKSQESTNNFKHGGMAVGSLASLPLLMFIPVIGPLLFTFAAFKLINGVQGINSSNSYKAKAETARRNLDLILEAMKGKHGQDGLEEMIQNSRDIREEGRNELLDMARDGRSNTNDVSDEVIERINDLQVTATSQAESQMPELDLIKATSNLPKIKVNDDFVNFLKDVGVDAEILNHISNDEMSLETFGKIMENLKDKTLNTEQKGQLGNNLQSVATLNNSQALNVQVNNAIRELVNSTYISYV